MTVKIFLSATDFPIKSVKVFSCGEAEVTRIFPLDLTDCPNESLVIEISKLPILLGALRPPSLTTGSDNLLIMDYCCRDGRINSFSPNTPDVSSDVLRDLNAKCTSLEDERQLRQKSFAFLLTYMDSLAQGRVQSETGPAQLVTFFDEFVELGKSRSEIIAVLDQQIGDIQKEMREEIGRLQHESLSLATIATVVLAPVPGHTVNAAELEVAYRVKATWKPIYEVHVTTTDGVPSSVLLKYLCQISQSTGEDWDDVELMVTTAKPDVPLLGLPEPKKVQLVQRFSQPGPFHWPGVRIGAPSWNYPGQGSAFNNILSMQQHRTSTGMQGTPDTGGASPGYGNPFARPSACLQDSGPTSQGLFGSAQAQSLFGAPVSSIFGASSMASSSESGPAPAQSRAGQGLFGSALPSAQSQASSATISDAPPPYPPSLNSVPPLFGGSTAPALHQNGESTVLAKLEKDITHTATAKVFLSSQKEAHHVLIATIPLNASFTRVAIPAVDARVFYTCEITNNSNYIFASGPVHIYLDGSHVSDSEIKNMAQPQTIQCSLGVDPEVTTEIERRITIDTETGFYFPSNEKKTHTIKITVKNTRQGVIGDIIVRASLPVTQNPCITVSLREPDCLATIGSGGGLVRQGCSARWAAIGKKDGVFEWVCRDVQAGSLELKATWDVTAPRDFNVVEE